MLELDIALPPGALCDAPDATLAAALAATGAIWWHGREADFAIAPKTRAVDGWAPRTGTTVARPTEPNSGNALVGAAGDLTGLQCREGVHAGLWAEAVVPDAATVTLALRYLPMPGAEARTLLTLNTGGAAKKVKGQNYLFVSEADGILTVKDDAGLATLTLEVPATDDPRMVVISLGPDTLDVSILGGAQGTARPRAPVLSGAASLFIGCRNHRPGLLKTLGGALIADVWLFPGRALAATADGADRRLFNALRQFHVWSGDT